VPREETFSIPKGSRLYCPTHQELSDVVTVTTNDGFDVAILDCYCARSIYLPPTGLSVEHVGTVEGAGMFPADKKEAFVSNSYLISKARRAH
jgi:hypothetical protein